MKTNKFFSKLIKSSIALTMCFGLTACSKPYDELQTSDFQYTLYPETEQIAINFNAKNTNDDYIATGVTFNIKAYDENDEVIYDTGSIGFASNDVSVFCNSEFVYEMILGKGDNTLDGDFDFSQIKKVDFELRDTEDDWTEGKDTLDPNQFTVSNFKKGDVEFSADITNNSDKTYSFFIPVLILKSGGEKVFAVDGGFVNTTGTMTFAPGQTLTFFMTPDIPMSNIPEFDSYEFLYSYGLDDIVK